MCVCVYIFILVCNRALGFASDALLAQLLLCSFSVSKKMFVFYKKSVSNCYRMLFPQPMVRGLSQFFIQMSELMEDPLKTGAS